MKFFNYPQLRLFILRTWSSSRGNEMASEHANFCLVMLEEGDIRFTSNHCLFSPAARRFTFAITITLARGKTFHFYLSAGFDEEKELATTCFQKKNTFAPNLNCSFARESYFRCFQSREEERKDFGLNFTFSHLLSR